MRLDVDSKKVFKIGSYLRVVTVSQKADCKSSFVRGNLVNNVPYVLFFRYNCTTELKNVDNSILNLQIKLIDQGQCVFVLRAL